MPNLEMNNKPSRPKKAFTEVFPRRKYGDQEDPNNKSKTEDA